MKSRQLALAALVLLSCGVVLGGVLLLCATLLFGSGIIPSGFFELLPVSDNSYVVQARARVKVGDERAQAIQALSDAWYHGVCEHGDKFVEDLFFYGHKNIKQVTVVLVMSRTQDGKKIVDFVGSPENNELHLYECLPPGFPNDLTATPQY